MPVQRQSQALSAIRHTYSSSIAFDVAETRLLASIQRRDSEGNSQNFSLAVRNSFSSSNPRETFVSEVNSAVGAHGFMWFFEVNHGAWLPLFSPPTSVSAATGKPLKAKRFILGNPLIAITMIEHDLDAGMFAPVEIYLVEQETGCRVVWYRPSGLIAGFDGASVELRKAAEVLDGKLEALVLHILEEERREDRASL